VSRTDVLVVCVDSTSGWRAAATELADAFGRAGARTELVLSGPTPSVRTFMLTELVQAGAARQAAQQGIDAHDPAVVVYCAITAALRWPRPGAIWLDAVAAENRPGRHGVWQRIVEPRRVAAAPMILEMSERSLAPLSHPQTAIVRTPVEASGPPAPTRDIAAITYGGDPIKRRLPLVLEAWARARRDDEQLVVAGIDNLPEPPTGVILAGRLAPQEYRALLRRARVYLCAPRREDYGIAPLEALADGCMLVTTPASGPYPAFGLARQLDPRLTTDELAPALRQALDDPVPGYAAHAQALLAPFRREAVDEVLKRDVLPKLLPGFETG
jgi:hypothetical protein